VSARQALRDKEYNENKEEDLYIIFNLNINLNISKFNSLALVG
jgi:hypothetical protein